MISLNLANISDRLELLEEIPLFKGLSHNMLAYFLEHAREEDVPKGRILFMQGDEAKYFYLVLSGWVKLFRDTLDGNEAVMDVLTQSHTFGESAIFDGGRYSWSAQTVEDCNLIMWPSHILKQQAEQNNQIALNMLRCMSLYREQRDQEMEHLKIQSAPQRIGCFLLRLCASKWQCQTDIEVLLPYDKSLIALRLGMKSETFSRALNTLKRETGIEIRGSTVTVRSLNDLSRYCCGACSDEFPCKDL
ncbi:MAG: Crp/Fnr family transcriptional regulator [Alphaproteobacteria bacterium]